MEIFQLKNNWKTCRQRQQIIDIELKNKSDEIETENYSNFCTVLIDFRAKMGSEEQQKTTGSKPSHERGYFSYSDGLDLVIIISSIVVRCEEQVT